MVPQTGLRRRAHGLLGSIAVRWHYRIRMLSESTLRRFAPLVPYVAVLVGFVWAERAWLTILVYHGAAMAVLVAAGAWRRLPLTRPRLPGTITAVVLVASAAIGPVLLAAWSRVRIDALDLGEHLAVLGLDGAAWALFVVYYFTVNPVIEELFWRGYLGSGSRSPARSDVWFAGYHVFVLWVFVDPVWVVVGFVGLAGAAWMWRQLLRAGGSLVLPILSHAVADASLIAAAVILAS